MSPFIRRSLALVAVLVASACSGLATEPHPARHLNVPAPHFDGGDTASGGSGYTVPH
jgi:hypothetical protein